MRAPMDTCNACSGVRFNATDCSIGKYQRNRGCEKVSNRGGPPVACNRHHRLGARISVTSGERPEPRQGTGFVSEEANITSPLPAEIAFQNAARVLEGYNDRIPSQETRGIIDSDSI